MKKGTIIIEILIVLAVASLAMAGFVSNNSSEKFGDTMMVMPEFMATSSPYDAITTLEADKDIYVPNSTATTSKVFATTFCIDNSSPDCITAWPAGGAGSQTPWTSNIDGGEYYLYNVDYITATGTNATSTFTAISIGTTTHAYAVNVDGSIQTDSTFYGNTWSSYDGNSMNIKPSGDEDDFFSFKSPSDRPTFKREGGKYIYIESSNVNDVGLSFRKDADHSGTLNYYKDENLFGLTSKDPLVFKVCGDYDDYVQICSSNNIPELSVASSSGFKINAGGTNALLLNHDGGNVGIGTTTASSMLTIGATSTEQFLVSDLGVITDGVWNGTAIDNTYIASSTEFLVDNNTTYTGGDFLTLTGTDFDVDTAAVTNGDTTHLSTADAIYDWGVGLFQTILTNSAGLLAALNDETGTGVAVFNTSPTLVTPALGTPSALVGTNISGTGASFTAGTATALATARTIAGVSFDGTANINLSSTGLSDTADLLYEAELNTFSELQTQIADETLLKAGTLTDTKYCIYDSASTDIICNSEGGGGATDLLSQIGDVSTTTLASGYVLMYDGSNWSSVATSSLKISSTDTNLYSVTSTAAQTVFTISAFTYTTGQNELVVFSNGILQKLAHDYTETSTTTFTFLTGRNDGDFIQAYVFGAVGGSGGGSGDITDVFNCSTGDCNTMTVGTSEYLTYGTGYIDANRFAGVTTVDATEFGYLNGVTSAIQTQFGAKQGTLTNSAGLLAALNDETGTGVAVFNTSPTLVTPALGTPSALVGTNISGTGASFTAGNVTTNANLTGEVTSTGNASLVADNIIDEANLKVNAPTNDHVLTASSTASGGLAWAANPAGFTDPMTTRGDIIYKDSSTTTARLAVGTADQVLTSDGTDISWAAAGGGGGDVGGLYGINVETLAADKTLVADTDKIYQYLDEGGANRIVTLATSTASAGDRFVVRHNGIYNDSYYLQIKQSTILLDQIYAGGIKEFIFNGTNWISGENGSGENDDKKHSVLIGYSAQAIVYGVAIGKNANGSSYASAVGNYADGHNRGAAIGYNCNGSTYGVAVGYGANGLSYGVALGYGSKTNSKRYSVALGLESETERYSEIAHCIDGSATQDYNLSIAGWAIQTADATPIEAYLGETSGQRFTINPESSVTFTILATARDNVADHTAAYKFEGLIKRSGTGTTTLVYSSKTVMHEEDASWDIAITADDTNEALKVEVTGDASNPTRWAIRIDEVETQF